MQTTQSHTNCFLATETAYMFWSYYGSGAVPDVVSCSSTAVTGVVRWKNSTKLLVVTGDRKRQMKKRNDRKARRMKVN